MATASPPNQWFHKWLVFGAVSLAFFFVNFATFASLGVVLFTMVRDLHWSLTAAGLSFSFLGLSCGLASPLPALTMKWIGGRGTMAIGATLLVSGFALASIAQTLAVFDVAIILVGVGFTFVGNVPGVFLLAAWFDRGSARAIGLYMMLGALGAALAPPIVEAIVRGDGWRFYWRLLAIVAALVGGVCLATVGNRKAEPAAAPAAEGRTPVSGSAGWSTRQASLTWQFILIAAVHVVTVMALTTVHSMIVTHLVKLGSNSASAARAFGVLSITATIVRGVAGHLGERFRPQSLMAAGLVLQATGSILFIFASGTVLEYASALVFGAGSGMSIVAATIVPLRFFGDLTGPRVLSIIALLTTFGAAGPIGAGAIADRFGTYGPVFVLFAAIQLIVAIPIFVMRRPVLAPAGAGDQDARMPRAAEAV
jgi:MFS family permease